MERIALVERLVELIAESNRRRRKLQKRHAWATTPACKRLMQWEQDAIVPLLKEYEARRTESIRTGEDVAR